MCTSATIRLTTVVTVGSGSPTLCPQAPTRIVPAPVPDCRNGEPVALDGTKQPLAH